MKKNVPDFTEHLVNGGCRTILSLRYQLFLRGITYT